MVYSKCFMTFLTIFLWLLSIYMYSTRGVARLFKMRGRQGGLRGEQGGADWDSKWWLFIDLCTKCNFIWGARGGAEFLPEGAVAPPAPPLATPQYSTHEMYILHVWQWACCRAKISFLSEHHAVTTHFTC